MRFLRHGPFASKALKKSRLRCPVFIVKGAYGVLPEPAPLREPDETMVSLRLDAASGAIVRNGRRGHGLGVGGKR
jgi:hypothetical protein